MNIETAIKSLKYEWLETDGFFWKLREGSFDQAAYTRLKEIFANIDIPEGDTIDRELVRLVWFIPTFMRWQSDGMKDNGKDTSEIDNATIYMTQTIQDCLGYP